MYLVTDYLGRCINYACFCVLCLTRTPRSWNQGSSNRLQGSDNSDLRQCLGLWISGVRRGESPESWSAV